MPTILIVDDITVNRLIIKLIIENLRIKCNFIEAENGKQALKIIEKNKIDIVFMDIMMPVLNGKETIKIIRRDISETLPVIAVTAYGYPEYEEFKNIGFDYLLEKPISSSTIKNILDKYIVEDDLQ